MKLNTTISRPATNSVAAALRLVARPALGPSEGVDFTDAVIAGIAHRLRELYGGNEVLNQLEAERLLHEALASLR